MLTPLPGARELLHSVPDLGLQAVLATSAPEDELAMLREVLDCDDFVSAMTSSRDVDTAKTQTRNRARRGRPGRRHQDPDGRSPKQAAECDIGGAPTRV
jgi:phosphoglycolate phosphatase-like HAD superfamily hydrolase